MDFPKGASVKELSFFSSEKRHYGFPLTVRRTVCGSLLFCFVDSQLILEMFAQLFPSTSCFLFSLFYFSGLNNVLLEGSGISFYSHLNLSSFVNRQ